MRGISAVAACVIVTMGPYACVNSESGSSPGFGSSVVVGVFPGTGGTSITGGAGVTFAHDPGLPPAVGADALPGSSGSGGATGAAGAGQAGAAGAGQAGAAGAGQPGAAGTPSEVPPAPPVVSEGALLAAGWDDNANFEWFTRREVPSDTDSAALLAIDAAQVAEAREQARATQAPRTTLDITLVLDTTGSMGDELAYLKQEVAGLWDRIALAYPQSQQRWALVAYRDEGDNYLSMPFDFTAESAEYLDVLGALEAEGGGDLPEASDRALFDVQALSWRSDAATARLAFWFSDAPHHQPRSEELENAILEARDLGVKLYPVASENASALTIHTMRTAAQVTGGRYLFLVGSEPDSQPGPLPCYYVSELKTLLLRVVQIEMDGRYHAPTLDSLLGASGLPSDGLCQSELGPATAF